jgi:hypothetical protein
MAIWTILHTFRIFFDHLVHFVFIWYIFPVWVIFAKKNLANLHDRIILSAQKLFFPYWGATTNVSFLISEKNHFL